MAAEPNTAPQLEACVKFLWLTYLGLGITGFPMFLYGVIKLPDKGPTKDEQGRYLSLEEQKALYNQIIVSSLEFKIMLIGVGLIITALGVFLTMTKCETRRDLTRVRVQPAPPSEPRSSQVTPESAFAPVLPETLPPPTPKQEESKGQIPKEYLPYYSIRNQPAVTFREPVSTSYPAVNESRNPYLV